MRNRMLNSKNFVAIVQKLICSNIPDPAVAEWYRLGFREHLLVDCDIVHYVKSTHALRMSLQHQFGEVAVQIKQACRDVLEAARHCGVVEEYSMTCVEFTPEFVNA